MPRSDQETPELGGAADGVVDVDTGPILDEPVDGVEAVNEAVVATAG